MKYNHLCIIIVLVVIVCACKTEPERNFFSLKATLTNIPDSTLFYLKKNNSTLDSAYVINKKLSLTAKLNSQKPENLLLLTLSPEFIYTPLLVANEQVTFNADKKDFPWNIDISGSTYQDDREKFNQIEYQKQQLKDQLKSAYNSDEESISKRIQKISDSLDKEKVTLIKENFNTYAALSNFKYHKTEFSNTELKHLYNQLDHTLKETKFGKAVKLQSEYPNPQLGDAYYDYSAINQKGDTISLSGIKEKHILLHFSSFACYGSQLSLPEINELYKKYSDHLEIISIATDANRELWDKHVARDSIRWNYLFDGKGDYNDAYIKYWETGTPSYVLISPDKIILEKWYGFREGILHEKTEKYLNK